MRIMPLRKAADSIEGLGELLTRHRRQKYLIQPRKKGRGRWPFTVRKVSVDDYFPFFLFFVLEVEDNFSSPKRLAGVQDVTGQ